MIFFKKKPIETGVGGEEVSMVVESTHPDYAPLLSPEVAALFSGKGSYFTYEPLLAQLIYELQQQRRKRQEEPPLQRDVTGALLVKVVPASDQGNGYTSPDNYSGDWIH